MGVTQWGKPDTRGSLIHDLHLAARKNLDLELEDHGLPAEDVAGVTVVAVHNGDFDVESLGGARVQLKKRLEANCGVTLEWWDAAELVSLALQAPPGPDSDDREGPDATLLPPAVRPFARLALDPFRVDATGRQCDVEALDRFVEAALPLGRMITEVDRVPAMTPGEAKSSVSLLRTLTEFEVVTEMLISESGARRGGNTFPALDALERMLIRAIEHLRRCTPAGIRGRKKLLRQSLDSLIERYIEVVEVLCKRLEPMLVGEHSLGVPWGAEPVNYSLRVLRIAGYLATAGIALVGTRKQRQRAGYISDILEALWMTNRAACEGPVTDDQMIEHALVWEFLLKMDKSPVVNTMAKGVIQRCIHRLALKQPLPALYQRARAKMLPGDIRDLVEAFIGGQRHLIEDEGSTLIPLALYLVARLGQVEDEVLWVLQRHPDSERQCVLQSWRCREDAPDEWYARELHRSGETFVFGYTPRELRGAGAPTHGTIQGFVTAFEEFAKVPSRSAAEQWRVPVVDRMAFKVFRTRPPMRILVESLRFAGTGLQADQRNGPSR